MLREKNGVRVWVGGSLGGFAGNFKIDFLTKNLGRDWRDKYFYVKELKIAAP